MAKAGSSLTFSSANVSDFQCQAEIGPSAVQMRRLSKLQLSNTVKSLLRGLTAAETTEALSQAFAADFPDDAGDLFGRNDNTLEATHINSYFSMAKGFANYLTSNSTRLNRFMSAYIALEPGGCTTLNITNPSAACIQTFIKNFGLRAFRRPLNSDEVSKFVAEYGRGSEVAAKLAATLFRTLMSPQFLFIIENQGEVVATNTLKLTGYELASRLSYHFWNDMPNETLLSAAKSGQLLDRGQFESIVNNVVADARTRKTFEEFFVGWLGLKNVPSFEGTDGPEFTYLAKDVVFNDTLRSDMIKEMKQMTNYLTWDSQGGTFQDLFLDDRSYTSSPMLMKLYGVSTPASFPLTPTNGVRLPASERAGVLTRAALLVSGTAFENPVKRGIHLLDAYLCIAPKPPDVANLPEGSLETPVIDVNMTTRERYAAKTASAQCQSCHSTINPFGFALTNYSALGQYRREEAIFDETGKYLHKIPVSSETDFFTTMGSGSVSKSPKEFSTLVANSMYSQKCFARKYYEFTYGKPSEDRQDGCALANLRKSLDPSRKQDLKTFFRSVTMEDGFFTRKMED
jgi:hypothetical protein